MPTVTISGHDYPTYVSLPDAEIIMAGAYGPEADSWAATSSDDKKKKALSQAYQDLQLVAWIPGYADDPAWQAAIVTANAYLAAILIDGSYARNTSSRAAGIKRRKAGRVEIEYSGAWKGSTSSVPTLPPQIKLLMARWLQSAAGAGALAFASGTGYCNDLDHNYRQIM